jgi:hypothetical protein
MSEEVNSFPLAKTFEEAVNIIEEKKETHLADDKAEAQKAPISYASPDDRIKYLMYCIDLIDNVGESAKNEFCKIVGRPYAMYSTMDVTKIMRIFLTLRVHGLHPKTIAKRIGVEENIIDKVDLLGKVIVKQAIENTKMNGIPIVGNLN